LTGLCCSNAKDAKPRCNQFNPCEDSVFSQAAKRSAKAPRIGFRDSENLPKTRAQCCHSLQKVAFAKYHFSHRQYEDTEKQKQLMLTQGLMGAWLTRDLFRKEVETNLSSPSSGWILCVNIFRKRLSEEMLVRNKVLNSNDVCIK